MGSWISVTNAVLVIPVKPAATAGTSEGLPVAN